MTYFLTYILVFGTSALGVLAFRRWATSKHLLDHPNERSSHQTPTPSGGGIVIAASVLLALNISHYLTSGTIMLEFTAGALLIIAVSFVDDVVTVHPILRIIVHGIAAALALHAWGGYTRIELPGVGIFDLGNFGYGLSLLWIVWLVNAYNFMDGIDGIAALQGVIAGLGLALVGYYFAIGDVIFAGTAVSAASAGFLIHNWHPASLFMGDVGSAFLGYCLACLPLTLVGRTDVFDSRIPIIGVSLVWLFIFDAILTLGYRIVRREKIWQPHRKHIYQRLVIAGLPHHVVSLVYGSGSLLSISSIVLALNYRNHFLRIISITMAVNTLTLLSMWMFRRSLVLFWSRVASMGAVRS